MKIFFIHFRTGERDGVSLEIEKRRKIFEELDYEVFYLSGYHDFSQNSSINKENVFIIEDLDIKSKDTEILRKNFFLRKTYPSETAYKIYKEKEEKIEQKLKDVFLKIKPEVIFVHNVFSTAYHLPGTTALIKIIDYFKIPTVSVNHDFWWERDFFKNPKYQFIKDILNNLPPKSPFIFVHQTINTLAYKALLKRRKIKSIILGDCFDFEENSFNNEEIKNFENDFFGFYKINRKKSYIFLQATRITQRKAIENSILFSYYFQKKTDKKIYLVLSNFIETDSFDYFKKLSQLAKKLKVNFLWVGKRYGVGDFFKFYKIADLVLYPSVLEGFGNQLLEAFWAKKPVVIFEYPVYKVDIKKEGYKVISLGDKIIKRDGFCFVKKNNILKAVDGAEEILKNEKQRIRIVENNFKIAQKNHSREILRKRLLDFISLGKSAHLL